MSKRGIYARMKRTMELYDETNLNKFNVLLERYQDRLARTFTHPRLEALKELMGVPTAEQEAERQNYGLCIAQRDEVTFLEDREKRLAFLFARQMGSSPCALLGGIYYIFRQRLKARRFEKEAIEKYGLKSS